MKNSNNLETTLEGYYDTIRNPKYKVGNWIVADNDLYIRLKNKLTICYIAHIDIGLNDSIALVESKNKYIAIKYSPKYICYRESDNEYNLLSDNYNMLAINEDVLYPIKDKFPKCPSIQEISKLFNWKLGKGAKAFLDYFV
jgi:hypothetical protein